eukprot:TRINITY_DN13377_c0_g1_i4.p3 TRINITY_DN13377_c0_g1~~TRINITY_DN13377_c0_g1_i4.p3  ORF type:complete len:161 (-),score=11.65 TRINITY_DN13377_c0_g1_i4:3-485(-)
MFLRKFSALAYTLLIMLLLSAASSNVFAEMQTPEQFEALGQGYKVDSVSYADLYLNWMCSDSVDGFNVYIAYSNTDNYNDFELLQTISVTYDSLIQSKDNFWFAYLSNINVKNQDTISLYITAFKGGIATNPSNIAICPIFDRREWHYAEFTTNPPCTLR